MNLWAKARWSILLPVVAVVVTTLLVVSTGRRWPLDYMPYGITAAWALNGPAFFPTPFVSPLDAPFADRLYSVFIGWLCFGAFLDWKREYRSAQLLTRRSARLIVFGALTVVLAILLASLGHHLLWEVNMVPQFIWAILLKTTFHVSWVTLCVLFLWLLAIFVWSAVNLVRSARLKLVR